MLSNNAPEFLKYAMDIVIKQVKDHREEENRFLEVLVAAKNLMRFYFNP